MNNNRPGKPVTQMRAEMQARQDTKPAGAVGRRRQGQSFWSVVRREPGATA